MENVVNDEESDAEDGADAAAAGGGSPEPVCIGAEFCSCKRCIDAAMAAILDEHDNDDEDDGQEDDIFAALAEYGAANDYEEDDYEEGEDEEGRMFCL